MQSGRAGPHSAAVQPSSLPGTTRGRPGAAGPGLRRAYCGRDGLPHRALTNWPHQGVVKAALPRLCSCCGLPAGPGVHCSWWHRTAFPGCLLTSEDWGQSGLGPNLLQPELFNYIGNNLIANCGHSLWCWGLRFIVSGETQLRPFFEVSCRKPVPYTALWAQATPHRGG